MIQKLYLILKEIFSGKFISLIVLCSIAVSAFSVCLFAVIGSNFNSYISDNFSTAVPPDTIKVSPKAGKSFLLFEMNTSFSRPLDEAAVKKIRRLPGVKSVEAVISSRAPMYAKISFFGTGYKSIVTGVGAPYSMISEEIKSRHYRKAWLNSGPGADVIPVLVPENIIKAYNEGMAEANGLPRISQEKAIGLNFILQVGKSGSGDFIEKKAVVVGFSRKIDALAAVIPVELLRHFNEKYGRPGQRGGYIFAHVKTSGHESLLSVSEKLEKMGFEIEMEKSLSKQIISLKKNVNAVLEFLMTLVILLAAIAVSFSTIISVFNRVEYYRILRIVGAAKLFIYAAIIIKYALLGFLASYAGVQALGFFTDSILESVKISGFLIKMEVPEEIIRYTMAICVILPVVSTLPALFYLKGKSLNRD